MSKSFPKYYSAQLDGEAASMSKWQFSVIGEIRL